MRIDLVGFVYLGFISAYCVYNKGAFDSAIIGLALSYLIPLNFELLWLFKTFAILDARMVSYERYAALYEIPQERAMRVEGEPGLSSWPKEGVIEYENFTLKYRPDTEIVLKDLSFKVSSGEKIGIVGRTGSGKSTIALSLFRIVEPLAGKIWIDGVDISQIGLETLRKNITIIPQEPTIFSGTLRSNLDPFNEYSEREILEVIQKAQLDNLITTNNKGIDFPINEGGGNLSAGEKQLICIARAVLRKSKIIVMDEATASIDINTEHSIQELMNDAFKDSTMLIIAHRINTIINCNKVMVLSYGELKEFDTPENLLSDKNSMFSALVKEIKHKKNK